MLKIELDLPELKKSTSALKGQCHDIQCRIFCTFFARAKNGCCSRKCRGYQLGQPRKQLHRPSRVEHMSFSSSNCHFPRPSLVAAIIFPNTKWLPKITDYRDTAALSPSTWMLCSLNLHVIFLSNMFLYSLRRKHDTIILQAGLRVKNTHVQTK